MRVLIVEDEPRISADIKAALGEAGYTCDVAADGEDAWFRGDTETYDLAILDLGLPKLDGLAVLKRWRAAGKTTPVLILTARGAWPERVEGIDAGADDYLTKPFRMEELVARARALIRRSAGHANAVLEAGGLTLDTRQMRVLCGGVNVPVSPLEYRLVAYLMHHRGRVSRPARSSSISMATRTAANPMRSRRWSCACARSSAARHRDAARLRLPDRGRRLMSARLAAPAAAARGERLHPGGRRRLGVRVDGSVQGSRRALDRRGAAVRPRPADRRHRRAAGRARSRWRVRRPTRASSGPCPDSTGRSPSSPTVRCCARARCGTTRSRYPARLRRRCRAPSSRPRAVGQTLYLLQRRIELPARLGARTARAAVALDDAEVRAAVWRFAAALTPLLLLLGALLTAAAWVQVAYGLRPLAAMRAKLSEIGSGTRPRLGTAFPMRCSRSRARSIPCSMPATRRSRGRGRAPPTSRMASRRRCRSSPATRSGSRRKGPTRWPQRSRS